MARMREIAPLLLLGGLVVGGVLLAKAMGPRREETERVPRITPKIVAQVKTIGQEIDELIEMAYEDYRRAKAAAKYVQVRIEKYQKKAKGILDRMAEMVGGVIGAVFNAVRKVAKKAWNIISGIAKQVGGFLARIGRAVKAAAGKVASIVGKAVGAVKSALSGAIGAVKGAVGKVVGKIISVAKGAIGALAKKVAPIASKIAGAIGAIKGAIGAIGAKLGALVKVLPIAAPLPL